MTARRQRSLFGEPAGLPAILQKVADARVLAPAELEALSAAVATAGGKVKGEAWQRVVAAWQDGYREACDIEAPRFTPAEARQLHDLVARVKDVGRVVDLIGAFWRWRRSGEFWKTVEPTPFGMARHLARVAEFRGREQAQAKRTEIRRARDAQFQRQVAQTPRPAPAARSTSPLTFRPRAEEREERAEEQRQAAEAETNDRRSLLQRQAAELLARTGRPVPIVAAGLLCSACHGAPALPWWWPLPLIVVACALLGWCLMCIDPGYQSIEQDLRLRRRRA